jgi:hypothetical protein
MGTRVAADLAIALGDGHAPGFADLIQFLVAAKSADAKVNARAHQAHQPGQRHQTDLRIRAHGYFPGSG